MGFYWIIHLAEQNQFISCIDDYRKYFLTIMHLLNKYYVGTWPSIS